MAVQKIMSKSFIRIVFGIHGGVFRQSSCRLFEEKTVVLTGDWMKGGNYVGPSLIKMVENWAIYLSLEYDSIDIFSFVSLPLLSPSSFTMVYI